MAKMWEHAETGIHNYDVEVQSLAILRNFSGFYKFEKSFDYIFNFKQYAFEVRSSKQADMFCKEQMNFPRNIFFIV